MRFKTATRFWGVLVVTLGVVLAMAAAAQAAQLVAPRLTSPGNRKTVQSLPAFTWRTVRGAASYQFEFSADRNFSSGVSGFAAGPITVGTTALTDTDTIPDGTYFWRVRALSAADAPGRWSPIRRLTKRWSAAPKLLSPVRKTVSWPHSPLLLKWSSVPYAVNYQVEIGTSSKLSNLVYGPATVQGPEFAVPSVLSPGTYYWAVRPIDAAGQLGRRSAVKTFTWAWPSDTSLTESNISPDATYEEPSFSWTPIAGAASYEVEVATDPSYPSNATIIDQTGVISTSYTASRFFPNHTTLYWRVRARDAAGDAGAWNNGQSFTELFDQSIPTVQNLHVVNAGGGIDDYDTDDQNPIIRWSPVPGASEYSLTFVPWSGGGCEYNGTTHTIITPATAWTPGANDDNARWEASEYGWTGAANNATNFSLIPGAYCVSLIAIRSASPLAGSTIESAPTVLGGTQAAFTYVKPVPSGTLNAGAVTYSPGIVQPAYGAGALPASSTIATAPLFEWQQYPGADGYYVIISNDEQFDPNAIVAGGYTNTTSWVPPLSLPDQTASYWWEVIPVTAGGSPLSSAQNGSYNPQPFDKNSTPPKPVSPIAGANVPTQPTFSWDSAQGAVSYTLEISTDPSFANPIETDTTDSTSFTSSSTLPAGKTLYWRVRANDVSYNLNWSAAQTFTHNLPAPAALRGPESGSTIPLMSWTPVAGASGYNVEIATGGGSSTVSVPTPYMTPPEFFAPGLTRWQVQAVFPGGAESAFSSRRSYKRSIPAPKGVHATKSGTQILVTWRPDAIAKAYVVQLSTTTGFSSPIVSATTENTAWVPQISAAQARTRLYWRLAVIDHNGSVGAYHTGVFRAPRKAKPKRRPKPTKPKSTDKHKKK